MLFIIYRGRKMQVSALPPLPINHTELYPHWIPSITALCLTDATQILISQQFSAKSRHCKEQTAWHFKYTSQSLPPDPTPFIPARRFYICVKSTHTPHTHTYTHTQNASKWVTNCQQMISCSGRITGSHSAFDSVSFFIPSLFTHAVWQSLCWNSYW